MNTDFSSYFTKGVLNPNAREFVPIAKPNTADETEPLISSRNGKGSSHKDGPLDSSGSEEESWRLRDVQLPDDLLSLETDVCVQSTMVTVYGDSIVMGINDYDTDGPQHEGVIIAKHTQTPARTPENRHSDSDEICTDYMRQLWRNEALSLHHQSSMPIGWGSQFSSSESEVTQILNLSQIEPVYQENGTSNTVCSLATEFSNIPSLSWADMDQSTGSDMNLISQMFMQLKMQDDDNYRYNMPLMCNLSSDPRLADVSAHGPDFGNGYLSHVEQSQQYQMEYLRLMKKSKLPWWNETNGDEIRSHVGPSSLLPANSCNAFYSDGIRSAEEESQNFCQIRQNYEASGQSLPLTDNAVVDLLAKLREEARGHAHIRNAYFEQARQAYFVGDKILARDASAKGQLYNRLMKAAQNKTAELIFQQRNMSSQVSQIDLGQAQLLDLQGLHVNEAVALLKRKLLGLRMMARSSRQRQLVFISIGAGYVKGSRAPSRLLSAVKRHLIDNELSYTEPQPGIVSVVVS